MTSKTERKKPSWPLWTIAGLLLVPGLYVASFGPACWIASRTHIDKGSVFQAAYWPVGWVVLNGGPTISNPLASYARLGMPKNVGIDVPSSGGAIVIWKD